MKLQLLGVYILVTGTSVRLNVLIHIFKVVVELLHPVRFSTRGEDQLVPVVPVTILTFLPVLPLTMVNFVKTF